MYSSNESISSDLFTLKSDVLSVLTLPKIQIKDEIWITPRNRLIRDGLNIDLSIITPRIMIMGQPFNRYKLKNVQCFLDSYDVTNEKNGIYQPKNIEDKSCYYKIYNLSCNNNYDIDNNFNNVEHILINENCTCSLEEIKFFCLSVDNYLGLNENNFIILHCLTGKGRSGMLAAAYLIHCGICTNSEEAICMINEKRTSVENNALIIPSQIRYVNYYENLLHKEIISRTYQISQIEMTTIPFFNGDIIVGGCRPHLVISVQQKSNGSCEKLNLKNSLLSRSKPSTIYNQQLENASIKQYTKLDKSAQFNLLSKKVIIRGDVIVSLFNDDEKICQISFNTSFIENDHICFDKSSIDNSHEDFFHRVFSPDFKIEIFLSPSIDKPEINEYKHHDTDFIDYTSIVENDFDGEKMYRKCKKSN